MTIKMNKGPVRALLSVSEAAHYLGVSRQWLDRDRSAHENFGTELRIPFIKISTRKVLYRKSDLEAFLDEMYIG